MKRNFSLARSTHSSIQRKITIFKTFLRYLKKPETMQSAKLPSAKKIDYLLIAPIVALFVFGLFWLDYETKSISDLFKAENLVAFVLYFAPTVCLCYLLHYRFSKSSGRAASIITALLIGIPSASIGLIAVFLLIKNS
ncbi:MAG: hypothetical protein IAF38_09350 [Bacteroidia bacterium]|nr:hypothetical protein [Bacteroidia bacterium]